MVCAIAVAVAALIGFGVGRIKDAHKLARIQAVLSTAEVTAVQDAKSVIAAVRSHL